MMYKITLAVAITAFSNLSYAQVLAPPSLPGQDILSQNIVESINSKNVEKYESLLSDHLTVFEDGKKIAKSKIDWMKIFGKKLSSNNVFFKISSGFSSTGRLLFIEYFNSSRSWGGDAPKHCCWSYDAVSYDIVAGKIAVIRRLRGGDIALNENGSPIR